jgi:NAD(P)-dependent dehydrogenase (short-subunit alcohol dehydrogenase family)
MDLGLTGKRAIVTGGSEGIGRAVVEVLAEEGCDVAFCARRQDVLDEVAHEVAQSTGRRLVPLQADVGSREAIDAFVTRAAEALGGIDIVINNVGASIFAQLFDIPDERWLQDIELKLMSYVRTARAAIPYLRKAGGGRIVNVGGNGGRQPMSYHLPGGASNAAILNLTVSLASYLAKDRIHVLTCAPGPVRTARFVKQIAANAALWGITVEEAEARFTADCPLGYVPSPHDVAGVVTFLASPRAAYMTGTTVTVDGGITKGI